MSHTTPREETSAEWIEQVLRFWFEELPAEAWFAKDPKVDARVRERFLSVYERLAQSLPEQHDGPRACLAAVIVLDQFPRNMFRGSPRSYATDMLALAIAERAIAAGWDRQLQAQQRMFLYMPFQHSEDAAVQARSVRLFEQLGLQQALDYAREHRDIVACFGRFPHRNAVLGRDTSAAESQFLQHHAGF